MKKNIDAGITVYGFGRDDRSGRVAWTLEELGQSYEHKTLDHDKGDHKKPEFLKINPMGRAPAMKMGDFTMHESAAMCLFLADHFSTSSNSPTLAPPLTSPLRGTYYQWCLFAPATIEPIMKTFWQMSEKEGPAAAKIALRKDLQPIVTALESVLRNNSFLVGNTFSVADIIVGSCLHWTKGTIFEMSSILKSYQDRLKARPAAIRAGLFETE